MAQAEPRIVEPATFGTAFEGLLQRGLGRKLTPQAKEELRAIGVDPDKEYAPAYTPEQWVKTLEIATRTVFPGMPAAEANFELGRIFIRGLERTLIGKAVFAYGRFVGTRRMLDRLTTGFRSSTNYLESQIEEAPEGLFVTTRVPATVWPKLKGRPEASPHYMRGILFECLMLCGLKDVRVELMGYEPEQRTTRFKLLFSE
jgi:uncharacterized protein (TIGR02265 family)